MKDHHREYPDLFNNVPTGGLYDEGAWLIKGLRKLGEVTDRVVYWRQTDAVEQETRIS